MCNSLVCTYLVVPIRMQVYFSITFGFFETISSIIFKFLITQQPTIFSQSEIFPQNGFTKTTYLNEKKTQQETLINEKLLYLKCNRRKSTFTEINSVK